MPETNDGLNTGAILAAAAQDVLETMFFAMVEPEPPEIEPGPRLGARVRFSGSHSGAMWLTLPAVAARTMAADFLSAGPGELAPEQVEHLVGELVNMVCGTALSRLAPDGSFDLQPPELLSLGQAPEPDLERATELPLDSGVVRLALELHG
jgi:CheY-specific phosphatase CheX